MKRNYFAYKLEYLLGIIVLLFQQNILAQNISKQQLLLLESNELLYHNPNEALKIGLLLLKSTNNSDDELSKIHYSISKIYTVKGDYNNAYLHLFEADSNSEKLKTEDKIKIELAKSEVLRALFLDKQAFKNNLFAQDNLILITDYQTRDNAKAEIILNDLILLIERQNFKEANRLIIDNNDRLLKIKSNDIDFLKKYHILKTKNLLHANEFESCKSTLDDLKSIFDKEKKIDLYHKSKYLIELSNYHFYKKEYNESILILTEALQNAKVIENLYLQELVYKNLILNFLATKNDSEYKKNKTDFIKIHTELEKKDIDAVNAIYNIINNENEILYEKSKQKYIQKISIASSILLGILIVCFILLYKKFNTKKRLIEIQKFIEITQRKKVINSEILQDKGIKKNNIPVETEQIILNKLKKFENSTKFTNKEMSLAVLAGQFETNTKYLSEIINKQYHVNFNTYINTLRINFIVEKLKTDSNFKNYKISYLADVCGFSSHSSFATIFKSITGITPIVFIDLLKEEKLNVNQNNDTK